MKKPIPFFELYVSFLSITLAIVMLRDMSFLESSKDVYQNMLRFTSTISWSVLFVFSALIKITGLSFRLKWLRKLGLTFSFILHGVISYCYFASGSYLGASAFGMTALFSFIVIFDVDKTELK